MEIQRQRASNRDHRVAVIDAAVALLFLAALAWAYFAMARAAEAAVRTYGYNVDSGAIGWWAAMNYFLPGAIIFALASLALALALRGRWLLHWLASAWGLYVVALFTWIIWNS